MRIGEDAEGNSKFLIFVDVGGQQFEGSLSVGRGTSSHWVMSGGANGVSIGKWITKTSCSIESTETNEQISSGRRVLFMIIFA